LHFVRERVAAGDILVIHVPTSSQYADIFTKGLPTSVFQDFRSSLNVRPPAIASAGGVRVLCIGIPCMALGLIVLQAHARGAARALLGHAAPPVYMYSRAYE
jgi:hypothetical protein